MKYTLMIFLIMLRLSSYAQEPHIHGDIEGGMGIGYKSILFDVNAGVTAYYAYAGYSAVVIPYGGQYLIHGPEVGFNGLGVKACIGYYSLFHSSDDKSLNSHFIIGTNVRVNIWYVEDTPIYIKGNYYIHSGYSVSIGTIVNLFNSQ